MSFLYQFPILEVSKSKGVETRVKTGKAEKESALEIPHMLLRNPRLIHGRNLCSQHEEPNLITGGHILQYSGIGRWAEAYAFHLKPDNNCVTNEEIDDLPLWVWKVA